MPQTDLLIYSSAFLIFHLDFMSSHCLLRQYILYINYTVTTFIKYPLFRRKASFKVQIVFSHKCNFLLHEDLPCVHQLYMKNANRKTNGNVPWCNPSRCFIMWFSTWLFANIKHIWKQIIQPSFTVHAGATCNILHRKYHCICGRSNICSELFSDVIQLRHVNILCLCRWKPSI